MDVEPQNAASPAARDTGAAAPPAAVTRATPTAMAAAPAGTLGLAAACWVIAVWQMNGMDMGTATRLGSFGAFIALWVAMMAAMMLRYGDIKNRQEKEMSNDQSQDRDT